jgi:hypothetical protein
MLTYVYIISLARGASVKKHVLLSPGDSFSFARMYFAPFYLAAFNLDELPHITVLQIIEHFSKEILRVLHQRVEIVSEQLSVENIDLHYTEKLKRNCVFLVNKAHRSSDGKALLVSFAKTLPISQSRDSMDTLTTALLREEEVSLPAGSDLNAYEEGKDMGVGGFVRLWNRNSAFKRARAVALARVLSILLPMCSASRKLT